MFIIIEHWDMQRAKKWRHFRKAAFSFSGRIDQLKTWQRENWKWLVLVEKINAIWWNIKINVQKLTAMCGYELPTNAQNFTQKDLTEVKMF